MTESRPTQEQSGTSDTDRIVVGKAVWTAIERAEIDRLIIVTGMRRSGNHAIINWLVNALESTASELEYPPPGRIGVTSSGRVAHINDLPVRRNGVFYDEVHARLDLLNHASSIILSVEDRRIDDRFERMLALPTATQRVHVRRSTLNLLASRIEGLRRNHRLGRKHSGLEITQQLLDTMAYNYKSLPDSWTLVDFDRWLTDGDTYRRSLLNALELTVDIEPAISRHGDGSSFTARQKIPTSNELNSRWSAIEWPRSIVELLLRPRNFGLLTPEEVEFLLEVPIVD